MTSLRRIQTRICSFLIVATFIALAVGTATPTAMSSEALLRSVPANALARAASRDMAVTVSNLETLAVKNIEQAVELPTLTVTADFEALLLDIWSVLVYSSYNSYRTYTNYEGSHSLSSALFATAISPTTLDPEAIEWLMLELQAPCIPEWGTPLWVARKKGDIQSAKKILQNQ